MLDFTKLTDNDVVVCSKSFNRYLNKTYFKKTFCPFKIMSYEDCFSILLGELNVLADRELILENVNYYLAKVETDNYFLAKYYNLNLPHFDLIDKHLYRDETLKKELLSHNIYLINPRPQVTAYQIIKYLYPDIKIVYPQINQEKITIVKNQTIDQEVLTLVKYVTDNIDEDIQIFVNNDYYPIIQKYFNLANIKYNYYHQINFFSLPHIKEFYQKIQNDLSKIDIYLEELKENNLLSNSELKRLIRNINDCLTVYDYRKDERLMEAFLINFKEVLNTNFIQSSDYSTNVKIYDSFNLFDSFDIMSSHVYILNTHQGNFPKYNSDSGYYLDNVLKGVNFPTSSQINEELIQAYVQILPNFKHLVLSYNLTDHHTLNTLTDYLDYQLIDNSQKELWEIYPNLDLLNNLYTKSLDNHLLYNEDEVLLDKYYSSNVLDNYQGYDHSFKGTFKIKEEVSLSPTTLDTFNKCPYQYYLKYILNIKTKDNYYVMDRGNYFHKLLELALKDDNALDYNDLLELQKITLEHIEAIRHHYEDEITHLDHDYLNWYLYVAKDILTRIKPVLMDSKIFQHGVNEKTFTVEEKENLLKITGKIDRFMEGISGNQSFVSVIDYKTGSASFDMSAFEAGINNQLPFYLYFLRKCYQNCTIVFSMILNILENDERFSGTGFVNEKFVTDVKELGVDIKRLQSLNEDEIDQIIKMVEEFIHIANIKIHDGKFEISPVYYKGAKTIRTCQYCKYQNICHKDYFDTKFIIKETNNG